MIKRNEKARPAARSTGLVIQEMENETLIYDLERHKAHCLNHTAALVWKNCDGRRAVADIAAVLSRELNAPVSDELVWFALDQLAEDNLLREKIETPAPLNGMTRRRMMKRLGVAAMVAVPVVTSLLAPTAAQAGTGSPPGSGCTESSQCRSLNCSGGVCT
jgi:hypothetical protein